MRSYPFGIVGNAPLFGKQRNPLNSLSIRSMLDGLELFGILLAHDLVEPGSFPLSQTRAAQREAAARDIAPPPSVEETG